MDTLERIRILVLEDDPLDADRLVETLHLQGVDADIVLVHERAGFELALATPLDLILADFEGTEFGGMAALTLARTRRPEVPFLFVSSLTDEDQVVESLTHGATDYVTKADIKRLSAAVNRAVTEARERVQIRAMKADLLQSQSRLHNYFDDATVGLAHLAHSGVWLEANPQLCRMVGTSAAELIGKPVTDQIDPADRELFNATWKCLLNGDKSPCEMELRLCEPTGDCRWVHAVLWAGQSDTPTEPALLSALFVDISSRKALHSSLLQKSQSREQANQIGRIGLFDWNLVTDEVEWSVDLASLYGLPETNTPRARREWFERVHPDDRAGIESHIKQALESGSFEGDWRVIWPDGTVHWLAGRAVVEKNSYGLPQRMLGVNIDITARKENEERMYSMAQRDPLTGLANRALLLESAARLLPVMRRAGHMAAFLFIDLDNFKAINDNLGHDVGDLVLKEVARRLWGCVRKADLLGRVGGDEFVAVLTQIQSETDIAHVATHILDRLRQAYLVNGAELQLSPSIGISLYPVDADTVSDLIKCADQAMYVVKQGSKNDFRFYHASVDAPSNQ